MNILLICHLPLDSKLGGAKVYIENAESYKRLGHNVRIVGVDEYYPSFSDKEIMQRLHEIPDHLLDFIKDNAKDYDVIEFEYMYLPFERSQLPSGPIFVARSILLEHHFLDIKIPKFKTIRSLVGQMIKGGNRKSQLEDRIKRADLAFKSADFINVPNSLDKDRLVKQGHSSNKIIISPYGVNEERLKAIRSNKKETNEKIISFVGTFDPRKGAVEFPKIAIGLLRGYPNRKLMLLGTTAMFPDAQSVLKCFPQDLHQQIKVIERYIPSDLPSLLKETYLGVYPSYIESFGFGAMEVLSKGIPVISYSAPGPCDFIPKSQQVKIGDFDALIKLVNKLLKDENLYKKECTLSLEIPKEYIWDNLSKPTLKIYKSFLEKGIKQS